VFPTKFQLICPNGFREDLYLLDNHKQELLMAAMDILYRLSRFRGEDVLEIDEPETRIVYGGHVCLRIKTKWAIFIEDIP